LGDEGAVVFMKVEIHLYTQSRPDIYTDVESIYQEGSLYCMITPDGIQKYPLIHIIRIKESYPDGYP